MNIMRVLLTVQNRQVSVYYCVVARVFWEVAIVVGYWNKSKITPNLYYHDPLIKVYTFLTFFGQLGDFKPFYY